MNTLLINCSNAKIDKMQIYAQMIVIDISKVCMEKITNYLGFDNM